ncbi:MAG: VOC family protein [Pseudomonadota bacterium]
MLTAVCLGSNDLDAATRFYDGVLATLGMVRTVTEAHERGYGAPGATPSLWVVTPYNEQPATFGNGTQIIFSAADPDAVAAFHAAALAAGGQDEGAPGPRDYAPGYYGAYCRDLDGNKLHVSVILSPPS